MEAIREIKENLKAIFNIETITRIYQEIANLRMNKIRQRVINNREFIEGLSQVYNQVKKTYFLNDKKKQKKESLRKSKRPRVVVFLSANQRFYGILILNIWKKVLDYITKEKSDLVIVGRMGKYLAEMSGLGHTIFYFELNDDNPEKNKMKAIIDFAKNYEEIIVFHGKFETILYQKVVQTNISEKPPSKEIGQIKDYLFEPSPEAVLEFFESELISAFFNQTILEHQLSRYATRMIAMYQATENAKERRRKLELEKKKLERQSLNKKQIELFSGIQLWD